MGKLIYCRNILIFNSYEMAARIAMKKLDDIAETFVVDPANPEQLIQVAMTSLGSKM
jgi:hypothetical protein